jgi:hypothetical protein
MIFLPLSRQRHFVAHPSVGSMTGDALAGQRLDPSRRFRRSGLEQIRVDHRPLAPPCVLDEAGLL